MTSALVIGGPGFLGRHTVENLIDHDYRVTSISRSNPDVSYSKPDAVTQITADRTDETRIRELATQIKPDYIIDCAAFYPRDVEVAVEAFSDADAYVYVSSGGAYSRQEIPKREDETPLHDCSIDQATDDTMDSYGPRKAEGDRIARATDNGGITGTSVRPSVLYGPESVTSQEVEPTERGPAWIEGLPINQTLHDNWINRVDRYERIVVPGDGTAIWHRSYVEDVADALRIVAEQGTPGEAYNVGDRRVCTLGDVIGMIADVLDTPIDLVYASRRELAEHTLEPAEFMLYHHPATGYPHIHETCKIRRLGWESTTVEEAMRRTVEERIEYLRDQTDVPPNREAEERLLAELAH